MSYEIGFAGGGREFEFFVSAGCDRWIAVAADSDGSASV